MRDTLGIVDENWCSKLKGEIEKVRGRAMEECALFGWGNNKHGQLAQKNQAITLSAPVKIHVPSHICMDETNKNLNSIKTQKPLLIEKLFCGSKFSGILLDNGEFWSCGNCANAGKATINALKKTAEETNPDEEIKQAQMQQDPEFVKLVASQQAKKEASDEDSEEWGGGRNKPKNKKMRGGTRH